MKNIVHRIIAVAAVAILIIGGMKILNYILIDDVSSYTRLTAHEFYHKDNIDILCLGASHCYRGIIPSVVSEKTGKTVFNASSSSQPPDASFALIREAVRLYDVEEVYLEISAVMAQGTGKFKERTSLTSIYLVSDYLRRSPAKMMLLLNASDSQYYINSFFPTRRNWNSVFDFEYIRNLLDRKSTDAYRKYEYGNAVSEHERYVGDGYVANDIKVEDRAYYTSSDVNAFDESMISDDWKRTISEIIDYCNKHNVKLTLYDAPVSNFQLAAMGNYDDYIVFIREFTAEKNVGYAEFNLLKDECFPYKQTNYSDTDHLNMYGAEQFSDFLSEYINGNIPEEAYHSSVKEKLQESKPDYYGIAFTDDAEAESRNIRLISNRNDYYEYKVEIGYESGNFRVLQEYDLNSAITIPNGMFSETGTGSIGNLNIWYRIAGTDDEGIKVSY